jgi:hypothetical protein
VKIPFVGPSSQARSTNADAQRTVNCYVEMDNASPRAPVALYGRPGMNTEFTLGASPVRGKLKLDATRLIEVAGNSVYVVSTGLTATLLGTIGTSSGVVGMASNGTEVLIVDGVSGWLATASALTEITDVDFPNGVTSAGYMSSYFIVSGDGSGQFYINETPNSGAAWNGLDFASAEGSPDVIVGHIVNQLELWLGGTNSFEIFVLTENADQPFQRSGNTYLEVGLAAAATLAKLDSTVFWLGQDDRGSGIVWRAEGYTPARISDHRTEKAIQGYSTISDAFAFTFQMEGHGFYVLTFPTAGKTHVYDVASNLWFDWNWRHPDTNVLTRWRPSCHAFFAGKHLVGDFENGKVYSLDLDTYSDDGDPILRLRATQALESEQGRITVDSLQVDMETGVGLSTGQGSAPLLMMRYSKDGGHTWSNTQTSSLGISVGGTGDYDARAIYRRLGQGRNWVFEVSMTDPCKFAIFGGVAKVRKATN